MLRYKEKHFNEGENKPNQVKISTSSKYQNFQSQFDKFISNKFTGKWIIKSNEDPLRIGNYFFLI